MGFILTTRRHCTPRSLSRWRYFWHFRPRRHHRVIRCVIRCVRIPRDSDSDRSTISMKIKIDGCISDSVGCCATSRE